MPANVPSRGGPSAELCLSELRRTVALLMAAAPPSGKQTPGRSSQEVAGPLHAPAAGGGEGRGSPQAALRFYLHVTLPGGGRHAE